MKKKKFKLKQLDLVRNWQAYLLSVPAIVIFFLFSYLPLPGVIMAFKDFNLYDGIYGSPWIEPIFANFEFYFTSTFFLQTLRNTFVLNLLNMVFGTVLSVGAAIALNEILSRKFKRIYQSILFLPYFFSVILLGKLVTMFTDTDTGILNTILQAMGADPVVWTDQSFIWLPIVVFVFLWKNVGYSLIVYLSSISGIDAEIYEAAEIDGAGRMAQIFRITVPLLVPSIIMLTLLAIGRIFYGDFQLVYAIVGNDVDMLEYTDIIETFLYRSVMEPPSGVPQYAMSTAIGLFQTLLGLITIFFSNFFVKLYNKDYALF